MPKIHAQDNRTVFLRDVHKFAQTLRPRLVLDLSLLDQLDNATLHLLLTCLEEVMKRNGDVRLASLCPDVDAALRAAGISRLFETYPTPDAAVASFTHRPASMAYHANHSTENYETGHNSENAA